MMLRDHHIISLFYKITKVSFSFLSDCSPPLLTSVPPFPSPFSSPPSPPPRPSLSSLSFLQSHPSFFPPILHFFSSSSSSSNSTHEAFNATLPLHASLCDPALPLHLYPFLASDPSFLFPFLLTPFSSSLSFSLLLPPPPPIPSFSSSSSSSFNFIHEAFNAALPLHANLRDPTLSLNGGSLHLRPFLVGDPSFPLFPILLTLFSSSSSFSLFFPPPPIPPFSSPSSSSNPTPFLLFLLQSYSFSSSSPSSFNLTQEAFNATLPLHGGSFHLHPFLADDPSYMSEGHFRPLTWQTNTIYW